MMSSELYGRLPSHPNVLAFDETAPDVVGIGGASAAVKGYIDVPFRIASTNVTHPLLVIENLSYPLIVGIEILRPHVARYGIAEPPELRFDVRVCNVCLEDRVASKHEPRTNVALARTADHTSIQLNSAVFVRVVLPERVQNARVLALDSIDVFD